MNNLTKYLSALWVRITILTELFKAVSVYDLSGSYVTIVIAICLLVTEVS